MEDVIHWITEHKEGGSPNRKVSHSHPDRLPMKPSAMWFGKSAGRSNAQGSARKGNTRKSTTHASVYGGQRRRSRMRENEVEKQFVEAVRVAGGQALKFTSQSMNGVPDRLVCCSAASVLLWN